jgi:hypothetical protein
MDFKFGRTFRGFATRHQPHILFRAQTCRSVPAALDCKVDTVQSESNFIHLKTLN